MMIQFQNRTVFLITMLAPSPLILLLPRPLPTTTLKLLRLSLLLSWHHWLMVSIFLYANLHKSLWECELLFLHHLWYDWIIDVFDLRQQLCTKDAHTFVHGNSYLFANHEDDVDLAEAFVGGCNGSIDLSIKPFHHELHQLLSNLNRCTLVFHSLARLVYDSLN